MADELDNHDDDEEPDLNQLAHRIVEEATEEDEDDSDNDREGQ